MTQIYSCRLNPVLRPEATPVSSIHTNEGAGLGGRKCWVSCAASSKIYYFPVSGWRGGPAVPAVTGNCSSCRRGSILHLTTLGLQPPPPPPGHTELSKQTHFDHIRDWHLTWHAMRSFLLVSFYSSNHSLDGYLKQKWFRKVLIKLFADLVNAHSKSRKIIAFKPWRLTLKTILCYKSTTDLHPAYWILSEMCWWEISSSSFIKWSSLMTEIMTTYFILSIKTPTEWILNCIQM